MSVSLQGSGDPAMQQIDLADTTLSEVRPYLAGASPKVMELFGLVSQHVNAARNMALGIEREISGLLEDNRVYPQGRYEGATKVIEAAQAKVDGLKQAQVAALSATKLLEEEAMPRFEGDAAQEAMLRDELRDIMSRSTDQAATLSRLAKRPRFAGLVASEYGRSLLEERGLRDEQVESAHTVVRLEAMHLMAESGTAAQKLAVERVVLHELGERMQLAVAAAVSGAQSRLAPESERVKRLGYRLMEEDARRVRAAGRAG